MISYDEVALVTIILKFQFLKCVGGEMEKKDTFSGEMKSGNL